MDSEPEVEMKSLPKRSTRGKRMHELIGEDAEADEAFWNQKAFQEDEEDKNYVFVDQEDIVDSDIDLSEDEEEEVEEIVPEKRKRSAGAYREPASIRALKKRMRVKANKKPRKKSSRVSRSAVRGEKMSLRKSTQRRTLDTARKQVSSKKRVKSASEKVIVPRLTQEEMLIHAITTEQQNKQSLKRVIEESMGEKKRLVPSTKFFGPTIRFHSRKTPRLHVMSFTDVTKVPAVINSTQCKYKKRAKTCVITGQPAKYRDPLTGYVYANLEAFREIRRRFAAEEKEEDQSVDDA